MKVDILGHRRSYHLDRIPSSSPFDSSVHRVCVGLDHVLETHMFGLRELVLTNRFASDVRVVLFRALVELLLPDAAAGVLENVDVTHLHARSNRGGIKEPRIQVT
jgi:hypothetical protein